MIKAYINLPVKDLNRSCKFFTDIGFTLNPNFMDEKGAAVVIDENIGLMLLTQPFFSSFTKQGIADTGNQNEVIIALEFDSDDIVDNLADKAVFAGGKAMETFREENWMYGRRISDLDGHIFEFIHIDMAAMPKSGEEAKEKSLA